MYEFGAKVIAENAPLVLLFGLGLWRVVVVLQSIDRRLLVVETKIQEGK